VAGVVKAAGLRVERVERWWWARPGAPQLGCYADLASRVGGPTLLAHGAGGVTRRAAAVSATQPEQAEGRPAMGAQVAQGRRDVLIAGQAEQADGDVAQRGHHARAVVPANLLPVFVIGHIPHVVRAVLDGPVAAVDREQLRGGGLLGRQAGEAVGDLPLTEPASEVEPVTSQAEDLPDMRKRQIVVERGGDLDGPGLQPTMVPCPRRCGRGKNRRAPGPRPRHAGSAGCP